MSDLISLNSKLDLANIARTYAARGIVQIPNVLEEGAASYLHQLLQGSFPWRYLYTNENDEPLHYTKEQLQARGQHAYRKDIEGVLERARENRGFYYQAYPMIEGYLKGWDAGHPIHRVTEFINSPAFLTLGRTVTGLSGITKADAHATAYGRGHFLTRHLDIGEDNERRAAYVLGMTQDWQPDWGACFCSLAASKM